MQAIQTKYLCPTNTRGSRIKAECQAKSIIVEWDYALNIEDNHIIAAKKLCEKLGWNCSINSGQLKDGSYAHVLYDFKYEERKNGQEKKQG